MTTATWDPNASNSNKAVSAADKNTALNYLVQLNNQLSDCDNDGILNFSKNLTAENKSILFALSNTLNFSKNIWLELTSDFKTDTLKQLIFLFTAAENFHAELTCGENSPAIKLYAAMKKNKQKLDKEELTWIRSNSTNKFIPNGSIF